MHSQEKNLLLNYGQFLDDIKLLDQSFNNKKECLELRKKFVIMKKIIWTFSR